MGIQIISASGPQNGALVSDEGRLLVDISGAVINIGSVSATVDSVYIQSGANLTGSFYTFNATPTLVSQNPYTTLIYIISGTSTGVTGSSIGSIVKYIGTGSYVKVLSYLNNNLVNIGSWS